MTSLRYSTNNGRVCQRWKKNVGTIIEMKQRQLIKPLAELVHHDQRHAMRTEAHYAGVAF